MPHDKQELISLLYQEFTQITVCDLCQVSAPSVPLLDHIKKKHCKVPTKTGLQLLSPRFQDHSCLSYHGPLPPTWMPPFFQVLLDWRFQIHRPSAWSWFQIFPKTQTLKHFLHCSVACRQVTTCPRLQGYLIQLIPAKAQHTGSCLGWERQKSNNW